MNEIDLTINGRTRKIKVEKDTVLLDVLRRDLKLTGAKQSCDRKGLCGACTVIVNNEAVLSCLTKAAGLEGAEIITVEGLGTPNNPHLIQEAFVLAGAVQCGFCTPGLIMATKVLLDRNPDPDREEIKKALRRNLCCRTGYAKIIDAVELAGKFLRGKAEPDDYRPDPNGPKIGVSHPRPSAYLKACDAGPLDPETGQGPSFDSQVHALQLAEVEVDADSGTVRVVKMTTAIDAGTVIHLLNLIGQLEGGMDMGAGWALREEYVAGQTKDWVTFKFPTMKTAFEMETIIQETPRGRGPQGAVGVGEMTMVPTAPAIINAIHHACGVWITELPAVPAKVKAALAAKE